MDLFLMLVLVVEAERFVLIPVIRQKYMGSEPSTSVTNATPIFSETFSTPILFAKTRGFKQFQIMGNIFLDWIFPVLFPLKGRVCLGFSKKLFP
jgi:hypothetical protein